MTAGLPEPNHVTLPWYALPDVIWPWPGNATPADQALIEATWQRHHDECEHCTTWPGTLGPREFAYGCLWAESLRLTTLRVSTQGESDAPRQPATVRTPAPPPETSHA